MYHNNRLIKAFEKVGCQLKVSGYCRFVIEACKEWKRIAGKTDSLMVFSPMPCQLLGSDTEILYQ